MPRAFALALASAGFTVVDHLLGSTPAVDFEPVAVAVIVVEERTDIAAAQTRRWRIELGDQIVPVLWLVPATVLGAAIVGFEAGADACLPQDAVDATLIAQINSLARTHAAGVRLGMKAGETRLLGEQLRKAYLKLECEWELSRRIHTGMIRRNFPVCRRRAIRIERARAVGETGFHEVRRLDENHLGLIVGNVLGGASNLLGVFVHQTAILKEISGDHYRLVPPEEVLIGINRELIGLGLEESPLVAAAGGNDRCPRRFDRAGAGRLAGADVHSRSRRTASLGDPGAISRHFRHLLLGIPRQAVAQRQVAHRREQHPVAGVSVAKPRFRHRALSGPEFTSMPWRSDLSDESKAIMLLAVEMSGFN